MNKAKLNQIHKMCEDLKGEIKKESAKIKDKKTKQQVSEALDLFSKLEKDINKTQNTKIRKYKPK